MLVRPAAGLEPIAPALERIDHGFDLSRCYRENRAATEAVKAQVAAALIGDAVERGADIDQIAFRPGPYRCRP